MKVLVTGANGQLGSDVLREFAERGHQAVASDIHDTFSVQHYIGDVCLVHYLSTDIKDPKAVQNVIKDIRPDAIVHCAAWTDVDGDEPILTDMQGEGETIPPRLFAIPPLEEDYYSLAKAVDNLV